MLIRRAEIIDFSSTRETSGRLVDIRLADGKVLEVGELSANTGEPVFDAGSNCLLPGLDDHHVHFLSWAASLSSVRCGPPEVNDAGQLRAALAGAPGTGWIRGYSYHEQVAGEIDRRWLDRYGPQRPIRIQHRTGRMWIVNSPGLAELRKNATNLTDSQSRMLETPDGRLFESDSLLRDLLPGDLSMVETASRIMASHGITGFNDMTPSNSPQTRDLYQSLMQERRILQHVCLSGRLELSAAAATSPIMTGAGKIHLHEADLPRFDAQCEWVRQCHAAGRVVAIHCVTETELVFALAVLREAGVCAGDRIEHASITPPALIDQMRELGVIVVTQPGFVLERGDSYLEEIAQDEHAALYRVASLVDAGIPVAFASDAPFSSANPWPAMQAAVDRHTRQGQCLGATEAVTPAFAVAAWLGNFEQPCIPRQVTIGAPADLCLLDRNWRAAKQDLAHVSVRATWVAGKTVYTNKSTVG